MGKDRSRKFHLKLIVDNTKQREKDEKDNVWGHVHKGHERGDCEFCETCQEWRDDNIDPTEGILPCGHTEEEAIRHSRPCLFASCRHHLFLEVSNVGTIKPNFEDREIDELEETCSIDVAEGSQEHRTTFAEYLNITPVRFDQILQNAIGRIRSGLNSTTKKYMKVGNEITSDA